MPDNFDIMNWGPWAENLIDLLIHAGGSPARFIGRERAAQQDAAEFAGWLRQQLFVGCLASNPHLG